MAAIGAKKSTSPGGYIRDLCDQLVARGFVSGHPGTKYTPSDGTPGTRTSAGKRANSAAVSGRNISWIGFLHRSGPTRVKTRAVFICEKWSVHGRTSGL